MTLGQACFKTALAVWLLSFAAKSVRADDGCPWFSCLKGTCFDDDGCAEEKPKEEKKSYGPCDCEPRKTLMQWSYGTSFSGGPPGMDEPLEADRPGFTQSSTTVGRGVVQLESGYMFTLDRAGGVESIQHDFPQMLWRIGLFAEWFEFQIEYDYGIDSTALNSGPALRTSGSKDLFLGIKLGLTPQEQILPQMALLTTMTVPSGSPSMTSGEVMPAVALLSSWECNEWLGLSMESQLSRANDDLGNFYTQFAQSISLSYKLAKKLSAYTEWNVFVPNGVTVAQTQHYLDGGFIFHLTNNIQFDIEAGVGLNAAADNFLAGTGLVIRF